MSTTHTLTLAGCAPVPLAHYLKALGILRLVSEQKDPKATGRWHRDQFVLTSTLDRETLLKFFLEEYQPTPVLAPWNGGSGFHPKDNSKALESVAKSESERLQPYANALVAAQIALKRMELGEKPTPEQKANLLLLCRNTLPEDALEWLDAAFVLTQDGAKYPPLLGTGGNDGRLEFTNNFMQRITEVMDATTGKPLEHSLQRLGVAVFADAVASPLAKAPVGQFLPGTAGGANATSGFDAASAVNPWDFILMIEGALLFASASVKRLESADTGALAYPFCVRQAGVGYGSATSSDESASRSEMWVPVWTQRAVTVAELSAIFSEGRSQVGSRAARNGVDFARAVVGFGVDRGLDEFQRYGFQVRNGLSYFATPLTRVSAKKNAAVDLLSDVDVWLDRFRRAATKDTAPASARRALSILESRIFDLCTSHTPERLSAVFIALGQCEAVAARSLKWATAKENYLQPLFGLRKEWLKHGWNSSVEFRLAASLASISGKFGKELLPMRYHLEQVISFIDKESGTLSFRWSDVPSNHVQWSEAALPDVLNAIASRRLILTEEPQQFRYEVWASISDIKAFIEGETNDALLSDLLWSMSLINWREKTGPLSSPTERQPVAPTLYALLKLCFPPVRSGQPDGILQVPAVPAIHRHAAQGNGDQAATMAIRRLRASGYHPALRSLPMRGDYARRTAAALLFPISDHALISIHRQTTRPDQEPANA
ncbi:MAG: type I-U CRISPR-associated protein Csx17 [Verrucomicrobiaceae bacterium]|nr:type I-U CRISPR-associated protein Csx17 [Verrucomicrobiaceae bacterium]